MRKHLSPYQETLKSLHRSQTHSNTARMASTAYDFRAINTFVFLLRQGNREGWLQRGD